MAVYTHLDDEQLAALLLKYEIGTLLSCKGIAEGVENSNYFLITEQGRYILTIYEKRVRREDLPFFLKFMEHVSTKGIPCPVPVYGKNGQALQTLQDKPLAITTFLDGLSIEHITAEHCHEVGTALAQLHIAGQDFTQKRTNPLSLNGWPKLYQHCMAGLQERGWDQKVAPVLQSLEEKWPTDLPSGLIHADLFPDNVLFQKNKISGLIDFYFACYDFLAYDLAICLNAWCFDTNGSLNKTHSTALLSAYKKIRPLSIAEQEAFCILAQGAALRFFLTRMEDFLVPTENAFVQKKDPMEYLHKLHIHQQIKKFAGYCS